MNSIESLHQFLQREKGVCERATQGPWECVAHRTSDSVFAPDDKNQSSPNGFGRTICAAVPKNNTRNNLVFIANSRTILPRALAAIEELVGALEEYAERAEEPCFESYLEYDAATGKESRLGTRAVAALTRALEIMEGR